MFLDTDYMSLFCGALIHYTGVRENTQRHPVLFFDSTFEKLYFLNFEIVNEDNKLMLTSSKLYMGSHTISNHMGRQYAFQDKCDALAYYLLEQSGANIKSKIANYCNFCFTDVQQHRPGNDHYLTSSHSYVIKRPGDAKAKNKHVVNLGDIQREAVQHVNTRYTLVFMPSRTQDDGTIPMLKIDSKNNMWYYSINERFPGDIDQFVANTNHRVSVF